MKPRIVLPPLFWLALALASFIAAFSVWQLQRLDRMRPPALATPAARSADAPAEPLSEPALPGQAAAEVSASGPTTGDGAVAPARAPDPTAGRQVLRCVSKGRVTYRDLNAGCPDGAAERVTVFPTEGVGKPK